MQESSTPLAFSKKHVFTLCVALSLMLRVKDSLPEGTIATALVVEATEDSSESDLSAISWKRLLLQRDRWKWAWKSRTRRAWSICKIKSKFNLRLMGRRSSSMLLPPLVVVSVTKRRKTMWLHIGLPVRFGNVTSITVCVSALIRHWIRPLVLNSQEVEIYSSIYLNEINSYMESTL